MPKKFTAMDALRQLRADREPVRLETQKQMASVNKLSSAVIPQDFSVPGAVNPTGNAMRLYSDIILTSSGNTVTGAPSDSKIINVYVDSTVGWIEKTIEANITLSSAGYTNGMQYDIFTYWDNAIDSFVLATVIWASETARTTALTVYDGKSVLSTDETWLYLTTGRYNGSTMLLPSINPNGELIFGTGNPRNNVADPHTGVGMSAGGVTFGAYVWQFWAAVAGVVGVGFNAQGQLLFGSGTFVADNNGLTVENAAFIGFKDTTGTRRGFIGMNPSNYMDFQNLVAAKGFSFTIKNTDAVTAALVWQEDLANTNTPQLNVNLGSNGAKITMGGEIIMWGGKDAVETVFNETGRNVDFRIEGDTDANALFVDASVDYTGIGTNAPGAKLEVLSSDIVAARVVSSNADARLRIYSNPAVSTSNTPKIDFAAMTSTAERTAALISANFTTTTDATRTSKLTFTVISSGSSVVPLTIDPTALTILDAVNFSLGTTNGTKIGTSATQKLGFWNATPVVQNTGWGSITNVTTDRVYDANATTIDELADVLGTLISTLRTYGILGA